MKQKDAAKEAMIEYIKELAAENLYNRVQASQKPIIEPLRFVRA